MEMFPVADDEWNAVVNDSTPNLGLVGGAPANDMTWGQAVAFCQKLSQMDGRTYRLPTEAEWEYACRAGTKTSYCTGDADADLDRAAWYGNNSNGTTHPVGQKAPNVLGLYDMHGNVSEWCADWCHNYGTGAETDPKGPLTGYGRVLRGGSWAHGSWRCRSAARDESSPDARYYPHMGFRVASDVPPKAR